MSLTKRPSACAASSAARSPSTLQRRPPRSVRSPPGAKRSSPRRPPTDTSSPIGPDHEVDPGKPVEGVRDLCRHDRALVLVEDVDHRRALGRADRELGLLGSRVAGLQHPPAGEGVEQSDPALDEDVGVVGDDDHRVLVEEGVRTAGGVHHPRELPVGGGHGRDLGVGSALVGGGVGVGQREEQEVEEVVLGQVGGDAAGRGIPRAREPQL